MSTFWLIIRAVLAILPLIINLVRDGRIRTAAQEEVVNALARKINERVEAAARARDRPHDDSVPDPNDRANRDSWGK